MPGSTIPPPVADVTIYHPTYEEFFQANWLRVVRYLYKRCSSYADAEDIASQAFLYCHQSWNMYDAKKASQTTWLFMVVRSRWLNYCRAKKNTVDIDLLSNLLFDSDEPMQQALELEDMRHRIAEALEILPVNQKKALIYRFFGNYNDQEIAQKLDTSPGNVRIMIFRALKKLKAYMSQPVKKEHEKR